METMFSGINNPFVEYIKQIQSDSVRKNVIKNNDINLFVGYNCMYDISAEGISVFKFKASKIKLEECYNQKEEHVNKYFILVYMTYFYGVFSFLLWGGFVLSRPHIWFRFIEKVEDNQTKSFRNKLFFVFPVSLIMAVVIYIICKVLAFDASIFFASPMYDDYVRGRNNFFILMNGFFAGGGLLFPCFVLLIISRIRAILKLNKII